MSRRLAGSDVTMSVMGWMRVMAMMVEEVEEVQVDDKEGKRRMFITREGDKVGEGVCRVGQEQEEEQEATGWKQTEKGRAETKSRALYAGRRSDRAGRPTVCLYCSVHTPNNA